MLKGKWYNIYFSVCVCIHGSRHHVTCIDDKLVVHGTFQQKFIS